MMFLLGELTPYSTSVLSKVEIFIVMSCFERADTGEGWKNYNYNNITTENRLENSVYD